MNKVILMGRLTKDPEISTSTSGSTFGRFDIAVDRKFKKEGEPDADFFGCVVFGKQAEFCENYLHKGTKILLSGRIQNDNYTNKDGVKIYSVKIMVEEIEFAESKGQGSNQGSTQNNQGGGFLNVPEGLVEELPFS